MCTRSDIKVLYFHQTIFHLEKTSNVSNINHHLHSRNCLRRIKTSKERRRSLLQAFDQDAQDILVKRKQTLTTGSSMIAIEGGIFTHLLHLQCNRSAPDPPSEVVTEAEWRTDSGVIYQLGQRGRSTLCVFLGEHHTLTETPVTHCFGVQCLSPEGQEQHNFILVLVSV